MVNRITLLLLFIGFVFSQDFLNKSRITEIQDLAKKNLELKFKTLAFHSILDIPINFFCGTIVGGFTATTLISSDWLFMGMLVGGTVYPSMKYHKNIHNINNIEYPDSIKLNEREIYNNAYLAELSVVKNENMIKSISIPCIFGCLGFVAIMNVLMNIEPLAG